jgi:hypothetical protein
MNTFIVSGVYVKSQKRTSECNGRDKMNAHKANALRKNPSRCLCLRNSRQHEAVFTSTDAKCSAEHVGYSPRTLWGFSLHPTSGPLCPQIKCLHPDTAKGKNGEVFPVTTCRHKGGTQVQIHSLSISILIEKCTVNFTPRPHYPRGRNHGTH